MYKVTNIAKCSVLKSPSFVFKKRNHSDGVSKVPQPYNEPILEYHRGTKERKELEHAIKDMKKGNLDVPIIIGGKEIRTGDVGIIECPYDKNHKLGHYHKASKKEVDYAIQSALEARKKWSSLSFEERAPLFLRLADLITGPHRAHMNAATIVGQSKNFLQAEIDCVAELADFIRFNVKFAEDIYTNNQPTSSKGVWNHVKYRPLEGFVFGVTPFNFTAIAGNICLALALMGNVVIWKPSDSSILSNYYLMKLYKEAGFPDGIINFIPGNPEIISDILLSHPEFAGLHFTGSTSVFKTLWKKVGNNINNYRHFPRLVGESGGKDFIFAHPSAHIDRLVTALIRGSFEFSGQKCSASSRAYIPKSIWEKVQEKLLHEMSKVKMGSPEMADTLVNAVINKRSFDKISNYIDFARNSQDAKILFGGKSDDSVGYFVQPTIIVTSNPRFKTMTEEIFGPVLTICVFPDEKIDEMLSICDDSEYALTGSIFAEDRYIIKDWSARLENSAGNFYINDKPTGAVVGQQPFGGARSSGTNDKAGSYLNLLRWTSPRTIKETLLAPTSFKYPYMEAESAP